LILINFSHPITPDQNAAIAALADCSVERVIDIPTQLDHSRSFAEQAASLVDAIGLSAAEWGTTPVAINLPAFAPGPPPFWLNCTAVPVTSRASSGCVPVPEQTRHGITG